ncbi:Na+/H+ antiporter [Kineococcus sp. NBC_00420]|uniref:Na+/H+ antiporter n=1 Tax=Kineococcus sp. NBC_00420 TaxID=2903564 RepID=UPI002E1A4188
MSDILALGLLVLGVIVLTPAADRWGVPQPVMLTIYGLALGLIPHVPIPRLSPDLILPLVLPPLLFAATQNTSIRELRGAIRPVLGLAVGLTLLTAALVAVVAHALGLPWAIAAVLGAVVAPPDPVAATAVAGRLHLPARLVTLLEGEGQFNDATALVVYQLSVMAVVAGGVSAGEIGLSLLVAVVGGLGIGIVGGWLTRWALGHLHDAATETTVTVAVPFAVYLLADHLGASGVLAVLGTGLFLRARTAGQVTSGGWLLGKSVWRFVDFLVSGLVFAFLGLELTTVLRSSTELNDASTWGLTAAVIAVLVLLRTAAMFTASALAGRRARRRNEGTPAGHREAAVTAWAGMRGVVTVATALALPATIENGDDFPSRQVVVVVALVVVIVTLVLQGLTLAPLIRRLGVADDADTGTDVRRLHHLAAEAALHRLREDDTDTDTDTPEAVVQAVLRQYENRLDYRRSVTDLVEGDLGGDSAGDHLRRLLATASEAERDAVQRARRQGQVSAEAAEVVLFDIESRSLRYET